MGGVIGGRFEAFSRSLFCAVLCCAVLRSTPYGIRGLGTTTAVSLTTVSLRVLNALRHQRFGHLSGSRYSVGMNKCSTPYGIRGLGTNVFS